MVLQRVDTGEAAITKLALDAGAVGVVDLKVALETVGTVKRLTADRAVVSVHVCERGVRGCKDGGMQGRKERERETEQMSIIIQGPKIMQHIADPLSKHATPQMLVMVAKPHVQVNYIW